MSFVRTNRKTSFLQKKNSQRFVKQQQATFFKTAIRGSSNNSRRFSSEQQSEVRQTTAGDFLQSSDQRFIINKYLRGKYSYLRVNWYFDINWYFAQFISKWGQTVDAQFLPKIQKWKNIKQWTFLARRILKFSNFPINFCLFENDPKFSFFLKFSFSSKKN